MKHIKLISILLVVCIFGTFGLTACDGGDTPEISIPQNLKYSGETITFLTCNVNKEYESEIVFNTYSDDGLKQTLPDSLNNDIQRRNDMVADELGVKIEEIKVYDPARKNSEMYNEIFQSRAAGLAEFDVVVPCLYDGASLAVADLLWDLNGIPELDMKASWWNQEFNNTMTFAGQLYYSIGEIGHVNKNSTQCLYFNLDLWNTQNLSEKFGGTPYDLVRQGKWTFDTMVEASKSITPQDNNNDGRIDYNDTFGWAGQNDDLWAWFFGSGEKIAQAGADGYPMLSMYNQRSAALVEKIQEFTKDRQNYVSANDYFATSDQPCQDYLEPAFAESRCMFYGGAVGNIINISGKTAAHFGVIPIPKADLTQDNYYSLINPWGTTCFAIPSTVSEDRLPMIAETLNAMGKASLETVSVSYAEILNYMKTRDEDSKDMLNNYILPNRACDIGMVYSWGDLDIFLQDLRLVHATGTFASAYQTRAAAARQEMKSMIAFYAKKATEKKAA